MAHQHYQLLLEAFMLLQWTARVAFMHLMPPTVLFAGVIILLNWCTLWWVMECPVVKQAMAVQLLLRCLTTLMACL